MSTYLISRTNSAASQAQSSFGGLSIYEKQLQNIALNALKQNDSICREITDPLLRAFSAVHLETNQDMQNLMVGFSKEIEEALTLQRYANDNEPLTKIARKVLKGKNPAYIRAVTAPLFKVLSGANTTDSNMRNLTTFFAKYHADEAILLRRYCIKHRLAFPSEKIEVHSPMNAPILSLLLACKRGDADTTNFILSHSKNIPLEVLHSAFSQALYNGYNFNNHEDVLLSLLEHTGHFYALLKEAYKYSSREPELRLLRHLIFDIRDKSNTLLSLLMSRAIAENESIFAAFLLSEESVDPNISNPYLLKEAVLAKSNEILRLLLEDGRADPTLNDFELLLIAVTRGDEEAALLILNDPRMDSISEAILDTCLIHAIFTRKNLVVAELLQKYHFSTNFDEALSLAKLYNPEVIHLMT